MWGGVGGVFTPVVIYDFSTATSVSTSIIDDVLDGALYLAQLWVTDSNSVGTAFVLNKYGNTVSSGSWLYFNSGLTAQTSLPQTVAATAGSAKIDQEHWIGEN